MPRDSEGLKIKLWADNLLIDGDNRIEPQDATDVVEREDGWPASYGVDEFVPRGAFNQVWREFSGALVDVAEHGVLEWSANQAYVHPARTLGTDGEMYGSVQSSGGALTVQDPTTDANETYWLIQTGARYASNAVIQTGTEAAQAIPPAGLLSLFAATVNSRWRAATNRFGLVSQASGTEITGRTGDGYVSAADLPVIPVIPDATTVLRGIARRATEAEALAGVAAEPFITPETLAAALEAAFVNQLIDDLLVEGGDLQVKQSAGITIAALRALYPASTVADVIRVVLTGYSFSTPTYLGAQIFIGIPSVTALDIGVGMQQNGYLSAPASVAITAAFPTITAGQLLTALHAAYPYSLSASQNRPPALADILRTEFPSIDDAGIFEAMIEADLGLTVDPRVYVEDAEVVWDVPFVDVDTLGVIYYTAQTGGTRVVKIVQVTDLPQLLDPAFTFTGSSRITLSGGNFRVSRDTATQVLPAFISYLAAW